MRDTRLFMDKEGRVNIVAWQGSTIEFEISEINISNITNIEGHVRDINKNKLFEFIFDIQTDKIKVSAPYDLTEGLQPMQEVVSMMTIMKTMNNINIGKYYYDIEITEGNAKSKILSGYLFLLPEYTIGGV